MSTSKPDRYIDGQRVSEATYQEFKKATKRPYRYIDGKRVSEEAYQTFMAAKIEEDRQKREMREEFLKSIKNKTYQYDDSPRSFSMPRGGAGSGFFGGLIIFVLCYTCLYYMLNQGHLVIPEMPFLDKLPLDKLSLEKIPDWFIIGLGAGVVTIVTKMLRINYLVGWFILKLIGWTLTIVFIVALIALASAAMFYFLNNTPTF